MGLVNHDPFRSARGQQYLVTQKFDTNNTSAPDGLDPDRGDDLKVARTGTGTYTLTFAEWAKPYDVDYADASILGDEAELDAKVTGYTRSTGVVEVKVYDEDDSTGISAAADSTDKTVQVLLVCTRSDRVL